MKDRKPPRAPRAPMLALAGLSILFVPACRLLHAEAPETSSPSTRPATSASVQGAVSPDTMAAGKEVFGRTCTTCHQPHGRGIPPAFPPLAKSTFLMADLDGAIRGVITGRRGEIVVNGVTYNGVMPPQNLTDEEIANVLTYVLHSWGNRGPVIDAERVRRVRSTVEP